MPKPKPIATLFLFFLGAGALHAAPEVPKLKVCMLSGSDEYESDASLAAFKDFLERRCPQCATVTRLATWHLHALFPAHLRLVDIEGRMRCRKCGRVGPQPWSLWRAHPPVRAVEKE